MPDPSPQITPTGGIKPPWYALSREEVAKDLGVSVEKGLSAAETVARIGKYGKNILEEEKEKPAWIRFLEQYKSYMQIVLVIAAIVSLFIAEYSTFVLLLLLTIFNAALGFHQEAKAAASVAALNKMMKIMAKVRRDGSITQVEADQIVPGDIVIVDAGDRVPADGRVIVAATLQIEESAL
ncbi:MAG: ATPase, partial [Methanoregulaceae archaeon]|nr:ATPase [Methanoregulaceae archaeon]